VKPAATLNPEIILDPCRLAAKLALGVRLGVAFVAGLGVALGVGLGVGISVALVAGGSVALAASPGALHAQLPSGPERIATHENRAAAGVLKNGVLELHLEARSGRWYPEAEDGPWIEVQAFGEAGGPLQIPAPLIRVREGTEIRVTLHNRLPDPLVVYGLHTRPGSPEDTVHVAVGATREVRFDAGAPGTYFYWGSTTGENMDARGGVDSQLSGAFVVDAADAVVDDRVFLMGVWVEAGRDGVAGRQVMTINGKGWPHTERFTFTVGDSVRWRWLNPTRSSHPMHLHGFYFRVDSRGAWAADTVYAEPDRRLAVTELMLPGGTKAIAWVPERDGNWLFHCHFPFHMAPDVSLSLPDRGHGHADEHGEHAMAGLVLGIRVYPHPDHPPMPADPRPPHRLRLLVQSTPTPAGVGRRLGYVLHDGMIEPPPDSVVVPGPTLVLRRGEPVAITVVNRLEQPTSVHWHGIELESFPDGVPGWSGTPGRILSAIAPADSFVARFTPPRAGTFLYHPHLNELEHIGAGLYGAIIVVEPTDPFDPSRDHVIVVGQDGSDDEAPGLVNGSRTPPPLELRAGETHRLRLINITADWRVMFSLVSDAGYAHWRPIAKDGADLPPGQAMARPAHLLTGPGETADFEVFFPSPGTWRLEVKSQLSGWHIPVAVRVRD
jgi:manganese oxidase